MLQRSYAGRVFRPALMLFAGPWTGGASAGLGLVVNGCRPPHENARLSQPPRLRRGWQPERHPLQYMA
jgi:hypothetical protein